MIETQQCPICGGNISSRDELNARIKEATAWSRKHEPDCGYGNTLEPNDYERISQCLWECLHFISTVLESMNSRPVVARANLRCAYERAMVANRITEVGESAWRSGEQIEELAARYIRGYIERFPEAEDTIRRHVDGFDDLKDKRTPAKWQKFWYEPFAKYSMDVHFNPRPVQQVIGPLPHEEQSKLIKCAHMALCSIREDLVQIWERRQNAGD